MSDMRATERLLEVVQELADEIGNVAYTAGGQADEISKAVTELRRRGDTLVRARDLEGVVRAAGQHKREIYGNDREDWPAPDAEAFERVENALGGEMR